MLYCIYDLGPIAFPLYIYMWKGEPLYSSSFLIVSFFMLSSIYMGLGNPLICVIACAIPCALLQIKSFLCGFLYTVFWSRGNSIDYTAQITSTTHHMVFYTGQVLATASSNIDNTVLLGVVAFAWNVSRDHFPIGKPYSAGFTLRRVRFLRFQDHNSEHNTFPDGTPL